LRERERLQAVYVLYANICQYEYLITIPRLQQEWIAQQTVIKNEMLQITYSYWDGQGHRRVIQV
jgi:hypothetical protein